MKPVNVAVSGASHSGKSTLIVALKKHYGSVVSTNDERIREYDINIDEIRSDASKYLRFEIEVVSKKVYDDLVGYTKNIATSDGIIISDRFLSDSIMYYTKYLDRSALNDSDKLLYDSFERLMWENAKILYSLVDMVIVLDTIKPPENLNDKYRSKELVTLQKMEYDENVRILQQLGHEKKFVLLNDPIFYFENAISLIENLRKK